MCATRQQKTLYLCRQSTIRKLFVKYFILNYGISKNRKRHDAKCRSPFEKNARMCDWGDNEHVKNILQRRNRTNTVHRSKRFSWSRKSCQLIFVYRILAVLISSASTLLSFGTIHIASNASYLYYANGSLSRTSAFDDIPCGTDVEEESS